MLTIIQPKTSRERRLFLELPWSIYKGDPLWIPPLRIEQESLVDYPSWVSRLTGRHPFYDHNEVQTFVAIRDGEAVGRVAAILNRGHLERYNDGVGFFGFFESRDDSEAAAALFTAAGDWLCGKGCSVIRGPVNPSLNHTLGLLIDGFHSSPFFMMTYNPPYYQRLFEEFGLEKSQDLYAYWGKIEMLPKVQEKLLSVCEMIQEKTGAVVRPMNRRRFQSEVETFLHIYNRALTNTWGFVPMSDREVKETAFFLKFLIVPELALAAEVDGKVVGVSFGLPDYNPRIKEIDGKLFPFGWRKLIKQKHLIKKMRIISTNVLPEYQMLGLGLVLLNGLVPKALEWGIKEAEFSWVLESNNFSRGSLEKGGAILDKTYRVYDKNIGGIDGHLGSD
ncbi:MAG: GNAT family N-acetyltransferase [Thermoguttaceae bacterium]